jgi:hypothetical protein
VHFEPWMQFTTITRRLPTAAAPRVTNVPIRSGACFLGF